jgi:hypothetical protein
MQEKIINEEKKEINILAPSTSVENNYSDKIRLGFKLSLQPKDNSTPYGEETEPIIKLIKDAVDHPEKYPLAESKTYFLINKLMELGWVPELQNVTENNDNRKEKER